MNTTLQLPVRPAYTDKGNRYNESNIGKFAAGTSVAVATAIYSGKLAQKGAKKIYQKAKTIKLNPPKISKPSMESIKATAKKVTEKMPDAKTMKAFVKDIPSYVKAAAGKIGKFTKQSTKFVTENAKKIDKSNIKKVGKAVVDFTKKTSVKKGAGVATAFALVLAAGYGIDAMINKAGAKIADKKA